MKKIKADEEAHIKEVGEAKFYAALAKAAMCVRSDSRLTGIDKIRDVLEFEAALVATGFPSRGFSLGKKEIPADTMAVCEDLLKKAIQAAA